MNGRTVCPACHSVFRVDDTQLAAAEGWVQCGVCGEAFDARSAMRGAAHPHEPEPLPPVEAPVGEAAPPIALDVPLADSEDGAPPEVEPFQAPDAPAHEAMPAPEPQASEPQASVPEALLPEQPLLLPPQEPPPEPVPAADAPPPAAPAAAARKPVRQARRHPGAPRAAKRVRWGVWSLVLLVLLLVQILWFGRQTVIDLWPKARPLYAALCQPPACTLPVTREDGAVRIVGSELQDGVEPGRYRLNFTLGNHAGRPQPWPTLVVALLDREQKIYTQRRFAPADYQPDARSLAAGIPSSSERSLTLDLVTRPPWPTGYHIDLAP